MSVAVIDLFAGAGGLSLGARQAGADVRASVETDPVACLTLKRNHELLGGEVIQADVTDQSVVNADSLRAVAAVGASERLIVVGGAPCQPFSKAAYWTEKGDEAAYRRARSRGEAAARPPPPTAIRPDGRRSLIDDFVRITLGLTADGFIFENVPSILHPRNRPVVANLMAVMEQQGYEALLVKANAAEHGVAQRRHRVFVVGSRAGVPTEPTPTHTDRADASPELPPALTAGEVLKDFEGPEFAEEGEAIVGRWAEHLREVPPGWNYKWHTQWAGHPNPTFEAERRFWNFLLKLSPDRPSWTIAASPGPWTGPFHWNSRRLRTVEMGVLQGFPPDFHFAGTRRERVRQIGNAVPSPLAAQMVRSVMATFHG